MSFKSTSIPSKEASAVTEFIPCGEKLSRGDCEEKEVAFEPAKAKVQLFGGKSLVLGEDSADEELYVYGNSVIWSAGGVIRKKFSFDEPVLEACWCCFQSCGDLPVLCMLQQNLVTVYKLSGELVSSPFSHHFIHMWPLPQGLILEGRDSSYALMIGPLESLQPAIPKFPGSGFGFWDAETIIWSSTEAPYLVSFSQAHRNITLWHCVAVPTCQIPENILTMTPGVHPSPKGTPFVSGTGLPVQPTSVRTKTRLSNGELSPLVFAHMPGDISSGPFPVRPSRRKNMLRLITTFDHICAEKIPSLGMPNEVCMVASGSGDVLICVLCGNTHKLLIFKLQESRNYSRQVTSCLYLKKEDIKSIGAISPFAAVCEDLGLASRHLIILTTSGRLQVWKGGEPLCEVVFPPLPMIENQESEQMDISPLKSCQRDFFQMDVAYLMQPIKLCDPVGNRITIHLQNGSRVRCVVQLSASWPLPAVAMQALKPALGESGYWILFYNWLKEKGTARNDSNADWNGFCASFQKHMSKIQHGTPVSDVLTPVRGRSRTLSFLDSTGFTSSARRICIGSPHYGFVTPEQGQHGRELYQQAWSHCQASERAQSLQLNRKFKWLNVKEEPARKSSGGAFGAFRSEPKLIRCLEILHTLYEDFKLDMKKWPFLRQLGTFLAGLAVNVGADKYVDHYARDLGADVIRDQGIQFPFNKTHTFLNPNSPRPADIHRALLAILSGSTCAPWVPEQLPYHAETSVHLLEIYQRLQEIGKQCVESCSEPRKDFLRRESEHVVKLLVTQGWDLRRLESLPFGIALPIREMIQRCKEKPPTGWPMEAYALLGRDDIVATLTGKPGHAADSSQHLPFGASSVGRASLASVKTPVGSSLKGGEPLHGRSTRFPVRMPYNCQLWIPVAEDYEADVEVAQGENQGASLGVEEDGLEEVLNTIGRLHFGRDTRLQEVRRLLCSSTPKLIGSEADADDGGPETHQRLQTRLLSLSTRTMALPIGRGAFVLGTVQLQPTEELQIPELCLSGRLPGKQTIVRLDLATLQNGADASVPTDLTVWPEFHNGVAAGLMLKQKGTSMCRSWISYNVEQPPTFTRAGVILSLGLTGHLDQLTNPEASRYLGMQHTATTIAILIGLGASKIGTMEANANTTMFLHLPHKIPHNIPEVELSSHIQAANLMALGLLYKGTSHRMMTALMLEEIGRRPGKNTTVDVGCGFTQGGVTTDREGYALAAGFALGFINLGQGGQGCGIDDMQIEETLRYFMLGGKNPQPSVRRIQSNTAPPQALEGLLGPGGTTWDTDLRDMDLVQNLPGVDNISRDNPNRGPDGDHAQVVLEGEMVNLDVTSPAATMALALMYLRTNNENVAMKFKIPESRFELDYIRPDFIMLRVLGKALVLWDGIQPTQEWIQGQLPAFMAGKLDTDLHPDTQRPGDHVGDPQVIAQAHANAVAGACLALGLRYAGTADSSARETLHSFVLEFLKLKKNVPDTLEGSDNAYRHIDKQVLESVINTCALSLSIVMAGTGHLPTFRLLRGLHMRLQPGPTTTPPNTGNLGGLRYGNHMAIGMAIGFLFLGGGKLSFCTDNMGVASLLVALFPKFPQNTLDQRCHLQAFRHLYVLATQPRAVNAVDVNTGENVSVPLKITLKGTSALKPIPHDSKPTIQDPAEAIPESMRGQDVTMRESDNTVRSEEDYTMGYQGSGVEIVQETPCLLPDESEVQSIEVAGPRYWSQVIDRCAGCALSQVYDRLQIFVKKKSGMLSYTQDPLGNRTLLSSAFHQSYFMPSPQGGYDLVNLCATYASDLSIMGFAHVFCLTGSQESVPDEGSSSSATHQFQLFCRKALYDCVTDEKPEMLQSHVYLYSLVHGISVGQGAGRHRIPGLVIGGGLTVGLWNLKMSRELYRSKLGHALLNAASDKDNDFPEASDGRESASKGLASGTTLMSPVFLNDLWYCMEETWEHLGFVRSGGWEAMDSSSALQHFLQTGEWTLGGAEASIHTTNELMFGVFLAMNDIPTYSEICSATNKTKELSRGQKKWQALLPVYLMKSIQGLPGAAAQLISKNAS